MDSKQILCCLLPLIFAPTHYAAAQADVVQQHDQILQQQQQRQDDQRRRIEQQQKQHQSIDITPLPDVIPSLGGPCFDIAAIHFDGAGHMPATSKQELVAPFLNQCIDLDKINQLLKVVSQWYFDRGYVTSRAYVTAQDLTTGRLLITVIEGVIEAIELDDSGSRINTNTAFPQAAGKLLNLRDIEQGLEQINRLQSNQATMDILPGETPGASLVQIKSQTSRPWLISLSRDNSGQAVTGELMNGLLIGIDNPFGLNDYSYLNIQKSNVSSGTGKASNSVSWHWDMPMGYWSMGLDISYFDYLSTVQSNFQQFETSGTSLSQSLFLSRVLYRDQDSKLKWRTTLQRKQSKNYIEDVLLDSSRVLGIGNIGIEYEKYLPDQSQWKFDLNYYRGLNLFGAPKDGEQVAGSAKAQFTKYSVRIDYKKTGDFKVNENRPLTLNFHSTLHAQYSSDRLFGSEQISIGSLYTVRGYKGSSISASSGAYWRNSLSMQWKPQWGGSLLQSIQPFVAFDAGMIRDRGKLYSQDTFAHLMGWATGAQLSGKHYSVNIAYARPHNPPHWLPVASEQWHFNLNINY